MLTAEKRNLRNKEPESFLIKSDDDSDAEPDFPLECIVCGEEFAKEAIVTRCQHYFHEACALKQFREGDSCAVCNEKTGGIYNPAKYGLFIFT